MALPPSIRVNVRAPFPSRVIGAAFIKVLKASGIWTISPDYRILNPVATITPTQIVALQDQITGAFGNITVQQLLASVGSIYRAGAAGGVFALQVNDVTVLLTGAPTTPTTISLPNSATRGGVALTFKDMTYLANTYNITISPAIGETIDGFSDTDAAANGVSVIAIDGGAKTFYPLSSGGWYVR